jgi:hypothetical protein
MSENFEQATKAKLRFDSPAGQLSVEDLWDLKLRSPTGKANLDDIAIALDKQISSDVGKSFVLEDRQGVNETLRLKFDIVKRIIDVRKEEAKAAVAAEERKATRARIKELIAKKQDEVLAGKSEEELNQLLATL